MALDEELKQFLDSIYLDVKNPAGFGGLRNLYNAARAKLKTIRVKDVKEYLHQNSTYTLHFPSRRKHHTGRTRCSWIDSDHQSDLAIFHDLRKWNDGFSYVILVVDVLSRYIWCEKLKTKTGKECADAYERILKSSNRVCFRFYSDEGKEYLNKDFAAVLKKYGIEHRIPKNHDVKCGLAENAVKRFKSRVFKYFTENRTLRYVDVMEDIVSSLNNMPMVSLGGLCPAEVTSKNAEIVWQRLYGHEKELKPKHKFAVGQKVRLSVEKAVFRKGYRNTFTQEIFLVKKLLFKDPPAYIIEDTSGEELDSIVYETELVAFNKADDIYRIEKVIRTRRRNGKLEKLVRWEGFSSKFDSWISDDNIKAHSQSKPGRCRKRK